MCLDLVRSTEPKPKHKQPFVSLAIQLAAEKELLAFENQNPLKARYAKSYKRTPIQDLEKNHFLLLLTVREYVSDTFLNFDTYTTR